MKDVLQALLIAGETMRDDVFDGIKCISIREGHRKYIVGKPIILCCHRLNWATMREVTEVMHVTLKDVSSDDYQADGFSTQGEMLDGLRKFYPNVDLDSPVTVIKWKKA